MAVSRNPVRILIAVLLMYMPTPVTSCEDPARQCQPKGNSENGNGNNIRSPSSCQKSYLPSQISHNSCCYRRKDAGNSNKQYCCPTQLKARVGNCQLSGKCNGSLGCGSSCQKSYLPSQTSHNSCCYRRKDAGNSNEQYCCPTQFKAQEDNCQPTGNGQRGNGNNPNNNRNNPNDNDNNPNGNGNNPNGKNIRSPSSCQESYLPSRTSHYSCCYRRKDAGNSNEQYCCPTQLKAQEDNCQPTGQQFCNDENRNGSNIRRPSSCQEGYLPSQTSHNSCCCRRKDVGNINEQYCCPTPVKAQEDNCQPSGDGRNASGNNPLRPLSCQQGYLPSLTYKNTCCERFDISNNGNYLYCCPTHCHPIGNGKPNNTTSEMNRNTGADTGSCRQDYHVTDESNYTCCYEYKAGGSLKYCCPSQSKALQENCRSTRIRRTTCPSDWARSFRVYDSRCYLFKISGLGDDYCCPVSSRPGVSCRRVGFTSSYRPNSARCFKHKSGEYCCPMRRRW